MSRTSWRWALGIGPAVLLIVWTTTPLTGQSGPKIGEWRTYGGDLASTRYSPLDQINAQNFNKLEVAWRIKTDPFGPRPEYNIEVTPLMANGVMYFTAGTRRAAVAADAATGELLWTHSVNEGPRGEAAPRRLSGRGLSYWTDGREERIFYVTPGYELVALNAKTGAIVSSFGKDGMIDLKQDDDQIMDLVKGEIGLHAAPVIAKDIIVVGAAHLPGGSPRSKTNEKGYVRGFDVRTGKRLWIFHTIPRPGEFGNNTWLNESWSYTGNAGVWAQMTVEEQTDTVFLPVELPTGDYYGGNRPGTGLFGESLVALDLKTGKRKWHYQLVHHGLWDHDLPTTPNLLDITVNGRRIKAVAQVTKQAFTYVFDRQTGQPVWPIEERPVPRSDVPGERTSPTQPFPTKPPPFDRQGVTLDDLNDLTPELKAEATRMAAEYKIGPLYTPHVASGTAGIKGLLMLPAATGGANWQGGAADPETGMLYVSSGTQISPMVLVHDPARSEMNYISGNPEGPPAARSAADGRPPSPKVFGPQGLPMVKPPWGRITAIDLNKGEIKWMVANGDAPEWIKNHPALKGVDLSRTGRYEHVGILVTKTLLFAGEGSGLFAVSPGSGGPMFRAYDKMTGELVFEFKLPANQSGVPMTYMVHSRQ